MSARVVIDTNVLFSAYDPSRADHLAARALIESDPRAVAVTHQSLREFLAVATRPAERNGYGLSGATATAAWTALTATLEHLSGSTTSQAMLVDFVATDLTRGAQVHDANVAAVALAHGATAIITSNRRHFDRFSHLIAIETLA